MIFSARESENSKYDLYRFEYENGNANPSILEFKKIANYFGLQNKDSINF